MATNDESSSGSARWIALAGAVIIAGALLFWIARQQDERLPSAPPGGAEPTQPVVTEPEAPVPDAAAAFATPATAPRIVIADKGRLTVRLDELREGGVMALGLEMPDDARGDRPVATKIIDVDRQRVLELEGRAIEGSGAGVRLDVDPEWLQPGRYMIQVKTHEVSHIPLRRYVLEVE